MKKTTDQSGTYQFPDVTLYGVFNGARRGIWLKRREWGNALRLIEYLEKCHRAALSIPGIESELLRTADHGPHYDPAALFVSELLSKAGRHCRQRIKELDKKAHCVQAITEVNHLPAPKILQLNTQTKTQRGKS
jgi:hypothetical protein